MRAAHGWVGRAGYCRDRVTRIESVLPKRTNAPKGTNGSEMAETLKCITPVDGSVYVERPLASETEIAEALARARTAQAAWRQTPLAERQALLSAAVDAFVARGAEIAEEIACQMGRPVAQCPGEVAGFEERARHMTAIAPEALGDIAVAPKDGFTRFIRRDPLGVVFVVAPWNYPI